MLAGGAGGAGGAGEAVVRGRITDGASTKSKSE